jgi:hypothetical protein
LPAKPLWLLHIPEIIEQVEAYEVPVLDRASFERVFGLRRRQAIELMHRFGGYQAGRTFLIDRALLLQRLRRMTEGDDFVHESRRRERLEHAIAKFSRERKATSVKIPVDESVFSSRISDLPAGVVLSAGSLHVEFSCAEDLLAKMFTLAQAISNDFVEFQSRANG